MRVGVGVRVVVIVVWPVFVCVPVGGGPAVRCRCHGGVGVCEDQGAFMLFCVLVGVVRVVVSVAVGVRVVMTVRVVVVVVVAVVVAVRVSVPLCPVAPGPPYERGAREDDQDAARDAEPGDHRGRRGRPGRHQEAESDHAQGVGDRDGGGQRQDVAQARLAAAGRCRRRHQGLAVAGRERVHRAQDHGDEQGQRGEAEGEVMAGHQVVQRLGPAVGAAGQYGGGGRVRPLLDESGAAGAYPQGGGRGVGGEESSALG